MPGKHRRPTSRVRRAAAATLGVVAMGSTLFISLTVIDQVSGRSFPDDAVAAASPSGGQNSRGNLAAPSFVPSPLANAAVGAAPDIAPAADAPHDTGASTAPTPSSTAAAVPSRRDVAAASVLRLQQLLANLRYLPVTFTPTQTEELTESAQLAMMSAPPDGTFAMRFSDTLQPLSDLWSPGTLTPMTTGAIIAFKNAHKMKPDATTDQAFWTALLADAATGQVDPAPYSWAWTTMTRPETLQIWVDGSFIFTSAANTGIAAAPTPRGSWPVYARYRSQTMSGTNPNGSHYRDPGVPYVNYFHGGDAIHGFLRGSYGRPQSLGCVELPYSAASQVWKLIDYGTVVTVSS